MAVAVDCVHIRFLGNGDLGFRPYGDLLFLQAPKKSKQKNARPERPAPRLGSGFLRSGIHPGALPSGRLRSTCMQWVRLRRTALRAHPRMNTSTQPAEGAGGSRSRAAGELTLDLMSGENQSVYADPLWERACSRRRPDSRPVSSECTRSNCGSWLACDGGLPANQSLTDVPDSIVGASLLAMAAQQSTMFFAQANHSDHSHKTFSLPVRSTISSLCPSLPIQRPGLQARE